MAELVHDRLIAVGLALAVEVGEVEAHLKEMVADLLGGPDRVAAGLGVGADRDHAVDVVDQLARLGPDLVDRGQDPLAVGGGDAVGEAERRGRRRRVGHRVAAAAGDGQQREQAEQAAESHLRVNRPARAGLDGRVPPGT